MKPSARNRIKGTVAEVTKGPTTNHVVIDTGNGVRPTYSITNEAIADCFARNPPKDSDR